MRAINDWHKFKAMEDEFMALNTAMIVLKRLLSDKVYEHLLLFCVACRLLSNNNAVENVPDARKHLKQFVEETPDVYGPTFMSLNIHNLYHFCDDVEKMNSEINEISAFSFESYLGTMGRLLRSPKYITSQYCRRMKESENFGEKKATIPPKLEILKKDKNGIHKSNITISYLVIVIQTTPSSSKIKALQKYPNLTLVMIKYSLK